MGVGVAEGGGHACYGYANSEENFLFVFNKIQEGKNNEEKNLKTLSFSFTLFTSSLLYQPFHHSSPSPTTWNLCCKGY